MLPATCNERSFCLQQFSNGFFTFEYSELLPLCKGKELLVTVECLLNEEITNKAEKIINKMKTILQIKE